MDTDQKRKLKTQYKSELPIGGVYRLTCGGNQRSWLKATVNLRGTQNSFRFAQFAKSCPDPTVRAEWTEFGTASFTLTVLEELKMKEDQTSKEFAEEIRLLLEMWEEKQSDGEESR
jgi:hypothetical protein